MSNLAFQVQPKRTQQQNQRQLKSKVKSKKKKIITPGEKILVSLLLIFSTIGCMMIVSNYASIYQLNKEIQVLSANITDQQTINNGLEEDITDLSKPERILQIATEQGLTIGNNNVQVIGH